MSVCDKGGRIVRALLALVVPKWRWSGGELGNGAFQFLALHFEGVACQSDICVALRSS